jgi:hypothetical protein
VDTHLLSVRGVYALMQFPVKDRLEDGRRDADPAYLSETSEKLTEACADCHDGL